MIRADDLSFDREGKRLAIGIIGDIIVVDAATGEVAQRISSAPGLLALSPDGSLIAVARGFQHEVRVLRVADGKEVASYATDDFIYYLEIPSAASSPSRPSTRCTFGTRLVRAVTRQRSACAAMVPPWDWLLLVTEAGSPLRTVTMSAFSG